MRTLLSGMRNSWFWLSASVYVGLFFLQQINLATADIGRHITNGAVIITQLATGFESGFATGFAAALGAVPLNASNYYSYTHPDFFTINHHWLYGIFAWVTHELGGFTLLTLSNSALMIAATAILLASMQAFVGWRASAVAFVVLLPLLTHRTEVRPETISMLLASIFFSATWAYQRGRLTARRLVMLLIPLQVIWLNTHLFFILGTGIIGYFWLGSFATSLTTKSSTNQKNTKTLSALLAASIATWLINPLGWRGALEPFLIFGEYGYRVAENQSLWFLLKLMPQAIYAYALVCALVVAGIVAISAVGVFVRRRRARLIGAELVVAEFVIDALYVFVLAVAGALVMRLTPFFALLVLPVLAKHLDYHWPLISASAQKIQRSKLAIGILSPLVFGILLVGISQQLIIPKVFSAGTGIPAGTSATADFIRMHNIAGPIFNNYDNGGYLIYYLHPDWQVFVDNRPEAYPADFFANEYIVPQENDAAWNKLLSRYEFGAIVFYRHDFTPWAQRFLIARLQDPDWHPVFVDTWQIILLRDTPQNKKLIEQYVLPDELFSY